MVIWIAILLGINIIMLVMNAAVWCTPVTEMLNLKHEAVPYFICIAMTIVAFFMDAATFIALIAIM